MIIKFYLNSELKVKEKIALTSYHLPLFFIFVVAENYLFFLKNI